MSWPNTPNQLAKELGISPKTLREFLRQRFPTDAPGQGHSWLLSLRHVQAARGRFG
jgi:hypothetical protein